MLNILFARHGQTDFNVEDRVCGRSDVSLTEEGVRQARRLGLALKDKKIDLILSSPLSRAMETARIINSYLNLPLITENRLTEWDYGDYEAMPLEKATDFPAAKLEFGVRMGGSGESVFELAHRVYSAIDDMRRLYDGKTVLAVCHGGVIRIARTYFCDMTVKEFSEYFADNARVYEYSI